MDKADQLECCQEAHNQIQAAIGGLRDAIYEATNLGLRVQLAKDNLVWKFNTGPTDIKVESFFTIKYGASDES